MSVRRWVLTGAVALLASLALAATAGAYSGQVFFGRANIEPAANLADGSTVYLLTPDNAPFPSKANAVATAPLYLPMYPNASSLNAADLNCQPTNCDHVPVVPQGAIDALDALFPSLGLSSVYPSGTVNSPFLGLQTGGLYKGHDHLVGVAPTGDFNVAWHVWLVLFTQKAVNDGAVNTRILTQTQLDNAVANHDVIEVDSGIVFNCSIVNESVYIQHMG